MRSTQEVLDHHLECFGQGDLDGDFAYILWNAETADNVYEMGTDTFVVRNDQIVAHSFALQIRPRG